MELKKIMIYGALFLLLTGFTLSSLGYIDAERPVVSAVEALDNNQPAGNYVQLLVNVYKDERKKPEKKELVCQLSDYQADLIRSRFSAQIVDINVNGLPKNLIILKDGPVDIKVMEHLVGDIFETKCRVPHGYSVIPIVTPVHVS